MSDNNLHLLFKRQVPEYVKTTYPLFVEFLKAYQEFLQQTQSQELEKFRDIDTVTDEFVERFKAELAYNIPLDDLQDKRMFLKNLREFYLSRGSEASYKFIFKTFFGKDVEISYPSRQMLRVSDGKWKQDVSIFVKNTSATATTLFPMSGNYITIKSGNKNLVSYVENVVQYSDDIFEVFIQRDLVKSIGLDSTVSFFDGTVEYSGNLLLTPKSIKVLQPGKGFRVGDVFNLKTNLGDGCKIKVTQVDGNGGIIRAKILKFALDYTSNFWSYLYAGQNVQFPPLDYFKTGNDNFLNVGDFASDNYIEYGYASKQTYMFYDETIPIGDNSSGASRFFADTNYVGDVYTQIYADNPVDVNLSDFAQILVEVGACSIYTGYYLSQDGFVSDEIYIQDSNYYQAFSYVIKVEEELRKYADLVKTILHPAGMKMFAEFQILNRINISATTIIRDRVIQISDILDGLITRGIGYTDYDITYDEFGNIIHTPKPGAGIVISPSGQLSYILGKKTNSTVVPETDNIFKLVTKGIGPSYYIMEEGISKDVIKELEDTINHIFAVQKLITKVTLSTISNLVEVDKTVTKNIPEDLYSVNSSIVKIFVKSVQDIIDNSVVIEKVFVKPASSGVTAAVTNFVNNLTKIVGDTQGFGDATTKTLIKEILSEVSSLQSVITLGLNKTISDQSNIASSITSKPYTKVIPEIANIQDPLAKNLNKGTFSSSTSPQSVSKQNPSKNVFDGIPLLESIEDRIVKNISILQSISSLSSVRPLKFENDSFSLESVIALERYRLVEDQIAIVESIIDSIAKNIQSTQNITSSIGKSITKGTVSDSVQIIDDVLTYLINYVRDMVSNITIVDSSSYFSVKSFANTSSSEDVTILVPIKTLSSAVATSDISILNSTKTIGSDTIDLLEAIIKVGRKNFSDDFALSVTIIKSSSKAISSSAVSTDSISDNLNKSPINEIFGVTDSINNTPRKNLASPISISSAMSSKATAKQVTVEAITDDSGSLKVNSYDTSDYFYPNAIDYQSDIVSIT